MKKLMIAASVLCIAAFVQAKPATSQGITKEQFLEEVKKTCQEKNRKFNQDNTEKLFDKMDADKDGLVTPKERQENQKSGKDPADKVIILG